MAAEQQAAHGHLAATAARAAACGNSSPGSLPLGKEAWQGQEARGPPGPFTPSLLTPTLRPASAAAPSRDPNPATVAAIAALKAEAQARLLARTAAGPTLRTSSPTGSGPSTALPATHHHLPSAIAAPPPSPQRQQLTLPGGATAQQQHLAAVAPFLPPGLAAVLPQILAMPVHAQMPTLQYYLSMVPPASGPASAPAPAPAPAAGLFSASQPLFPPDAAIAAVQQPSAPLPPPQADPAQQSVAQQSRLQPQQPSAAAGTSTQGSEAVQAAGEAPGAAPVSSHPQSTEALQLLDSSSGPSSSLRVQPQAASPAATGSEMPSGHAAAVLPTGAPAMPPASAGSAPFAETKPADAAAAPLAMAAAAAQPSGASMAPAASAAAAGMPPAADLAGEAPSAAAAVAPGGMLREAPSLFPMVAPMPPTAPAAARGPAQPAEAAETPRGAARTAAEEDVVARERPSPELASLGPPVVGSTAAAQPEGGESCGARADSMHAAEGPRLVSSAAS